MSPTATFSCTVQSGSFLCLGWSSNQDTGCPGSFMCTAGVALPTF